MVYRISIELDEPFEDKLAKELLVQVAEAVLEQEEQPDRTGVTVSITDDEAIQRMNYLYRHIDWPTDVLAFPTSEGEPLVLPEDALLELGDVVISYPTAETQAERLGHSVEAEVALLVIHGCLHLMGYDHEDEARRREMWDRQDEILEHLGLPQISYMDRDVPDEG